ncbi:MAG: Hsp20/alpha crystallin family protein [Anaerolineae bacterium]|nr:Hsp20/alpha crystallin family protein [Anaerolineae bacterium]
MLRQPFGSQYSWRDMERLRREMERLFATPARTSGNFAPTYPAMNVWTNEDGAVVTAELPGIAADDISISITGDTVTLSGSRKPEEPGEDAAYLRRERRHGNFTRVFQLPHKIAADQVEAVFKKGVLHISLPRAEDDKPKKIAVKVG